MAEPASTLLEMLGSRASTESKGGYCLVGSMGLTLDERWIQSGSDGNLSKRTPASCALSKPSLEGLGEDLTEGRSEGERETDDMKARSCS